MAENIHKMQLSIIIVNRNTSDLLIGCLSKIFESELDNRPQVIVIDNGSTDGSIAVIRDLFPEVIAFEAGKNLGFAAANNLGFTMSSAEFVLLINTDALLEKDCVSKMLDLARSDDRIALIGPQLLNRDGTNQTSYEATPTLLTETTSRSLLKRLFPKRYPGKHERLCGPTDVETLIGAVMLIRRKAFDQAGGFDPRYFFFFEETDLAVRFRLAGWRVVHEPTARATHLQGGSAKSSRAAARIEFYRSRYIFFDKLYGPVSKNLLKTVVMFNLGLNVIIYGTINFVTLGFSKEIREKLEVWSALWMWHLRGCPDGYGLPRN
ncbi:MAG: glycosyltransferase family 2 protein [Deltaproteobacteria bacterium]|nr:glycosyltransferase family 2 protein [Deltaproteobacteria bacterium]